MINGVLWRLRTGAPVGDLPERHGPWQTAYERFTRWETDGTWARLLEQVQIRDDSVGAVEWTVSVDSTVSRAHQHAADARKRGRRRERIGRSGTRGGSPVARPVPRWADHQGPPCLRRPGHAPGRRRPARNVSDSTVFDALMHALRVPRTGVGRPRRRPDVVIADKAYSSRAMRQALRGRGIRTVIPERADQKANRIRRGQAGGRPLAFDRELYKTRNVVERCFGRLKQFRAIATRFDKLADRYRAGVHLASLILWLREPARDPLSDRSWPGGHHSLPHSERPRSARSAAFSLSAVHCGDARRGRRRHAL